MKFNSSVTSILFTVLIFCFLFSCSKETSKEKNSKDSAQNIQNENQTSESTDTKKEIKELPTPDLSPINLVEELIMHPNGDTFKLLIPEGFSVKPVAWGMKRIRFMDMSSDGRLFLTDMANLSDNTIGKVYILDEFNDSSMTFNNKVTYLEKLRNPNSLAFHKDKSGKEWLYLALTDKLIRCAYEAGSDKPTSAPEVLDTYPDHGLSYRYGGWHLTRTIEFADNGKMYISVGSSCNTCIEKEEVRASIIEMDPDGKNRKIYAKGVRNAVGLEWVDGSLYATNMAADHLGHDKPDDVLFRVDENKHYGWPYCYHWQGKVYEDPKYDTTKNKISLKDVPEAYSYLGAHTAPLGLAWFGDNEAEDPVLQNYFLVAQHGSFTTDIGRGYNLQRVSKGKTPEDFITGFLDENKKIHGRPCGIYSISKDRFYFTDDKFGTLYLVYKK